ncbi:FAD-dependent monooxygenase [Streptomyces caatingaensis]|uniref:FAD-binding domain-containing protein n=1 Tax=Streptomyces caatingaensis TaxID=1678637 RepID=A0A0K9XCF2_9ACTN|nr:FAD-dependent monooxygenase [Streptomyces caatingaensis]KNB50786.1 hypothetical protein AC230_20280 [Streptomyces caatingaensis]
MAAADTASADVPVLIAGAGPAGLVLGLLLDRFGVPSLTVERRASPGALPRSRAVNTRTMEVFRWLGVAGEVRDAALGREDAGLPFAFARTLASLHEPDALVARSVVTGRRAGHSPVATVLCPQDVVEEILRRRVPAGRVRHGVRLAGLEQDGTGVTARLVDANGLVEQVRCRYVVGCDGAHSAVRRALGLRLRPGGPVAENRHVLFEAGLGPLLGDRAAGIVFLHAGGVRGYLQPTARPDRWTFNRILDPGAPGLPDEAVVRAVTGRDDVPVTVLAARDWTSRSEAADRMSAGRGFLAGDAAHLVTPFSGSGLNLGVQDAHNLAWKLAAVLRGRAGPGLLESYDAERRPVAERHVREDRAGTAAALATGSWDRWRVELPRRRVKDGLVLGVHYESGALVPDGTPRPAPPDARTEYVPTARPGHRAPHLPLGPAAARGSLLDLFTTELTLLAGPDGGPWATAAARLSARLGVPVHAYVLGRDPSWIAPSWTALYGITSGGAVLVRPDGHVAWRDPHARPREEAAPVLDRAVRTVLCRDG